MIYIPKSLIPKPCHHNTNSILLKWLNTLNIPRDSISVDYGFSYVLWWRLISGCLTKLPLCVVPYSWSLLLPLCQVLQVHCICLREIVQPRCLPFFKVSLVFLLYFSMWVGLRYLCLHLSYPFCRHTIILPCVLLIRIRYTFHQVEYFRWSLTS